MLLTSVAFTAELGVKGFKIVFALSLSKLLTQIFVYNVGLNVTNKLDVVHHLYIFTHKDDQRKKLLLIICGYKSSFLKAFGHAMH